MIAVPGGEYHLPGDTTTVSVHSFFIGQYEETNKQYRAFLSFLQCYSKMPYFDSLLHTAYPDTSIWHDAPLSKEDRGWLAKNYLSDPRYDDYPVLGLSPLQAKAYAAWKTNRLNELIMIREGILDYQLCGAEYGEPFSTDRYLNASFTNPSLPEGLPVLHDTRRVRMEDGILMPRLRPLTSSENIAVTEAQWNTRTTVNLWKPYKQRKFDEKNVMPYLFPKTKKWKPDSLQTRLQKTGLVPVYAGKPDVNKIFHLSDNAGEWMHDSLTSCGAGEAWKNNGLRLAMDIVW